MGKNAKKLTLPQIRNINLHIHLCQKILISKCTTFNVNFNKVAKLKIPRKK